jgi:FHA domain
MTPVQPEPAPVLDSPAVTPALSTPPTTPIPSLTSVTWTVLIACDRVYYDRRRATGSSAASPVEFPAHVSERRIPLAGKQMRIGRRSAGRELIPEIDLAGPPADPGISRLHAVLLADSGGTWSIVDPGSANGTLLNGRELAIGEPVTLHEGDRINLGAWTVITVHRG